MTVIEDRAAILAEVEGLSLVSLLRRNVRDHGDDAALSWRAGDEWVSATWGEYGALVERAASALVAAGVHPGDRIAVVAGNQPEHVVLDLAALTVGAVPVSVYATLTAEQLSHVLRDSGAVLAFAADSALARVTEAASLAGVRSVVELDGEGWSTFLDRGVEDVAPRTPSLDEPATIIYTSGTTGHPKGVVLTQRNVLFLLGALERVAPFPGGYINVSYLPLAHIAERLFSHYIGVLRHGHTWFCLDQADLLDTLTSARPQAFLGVPRVWEKLRQGLSAALPVPVSELPPAVLSTLRERIGLDRCTLAISGAAPMSVDVLQFWDQLGVPICEAYGMTETTGVTNINRPGDAVFGTVGQALPGVEVRLLADGEVAARGPNIMPGYLGHDAAATDGDGWLATGDLGELSEDGRLRIVGRKKELIVTAGGKNIAPVPFETVLKEHPLVAHACLVGDRRPYLTALVALDPDELARRGVSGDDDAVLAEIEELVERANARFSRVEQVKRHAVLTSEWSSDSGELTPTLKLRRAVVHDKYAEIIDSLYAG